MTTTPDPKQPGDEVASEQNWLDPTILALVGRLAKYFGLPLDCIIATRRRLGDGHRYFVHVLAPSGIKIFFIELYWHGDEWWYDDVTIATTADWNGFHESIETPMRADGTTAIRSLA